MDTVNQDTDIILREEVLAQFLNRAQAIATDKMMPYYNAVFFDRPGYYVFDLITRPDGKTDWQGRFADQKISEENWTFKLNMTTGKVEYIR